MNPIRIASFSFFFLLLCTQVCLSQEPVTPKLIWEVNKIDLGTLLEEEGNQLAEFKFTHTQDSLFWIERVWTDCGCTTVAYSEDTLRVGEEGTLQISFNPSTGAGPFLRMIVVKGNLMGTQDTLFLEGNAIPFPQDPMIEYPFRQRGVGFRQEKVNMGEVFTNEPKIKNVEFFNFSDETIFKDSLKYFGPEHLQFALLEDSVTQDSRGLIQVIYSGEMKDDLGFFEDPVSVSLTDSLIVQMDVLANVFEFYPAFSKEDLGVVANLTISPKELDLKTISKNSVQKESVTLTNKGQTKLEIRKIQGNCDCLTMTMPKDELSPGESVELQIIFDPKGRQGIDQRNIYVFSNDPLNPVQLLVLKSRIE